MKKIVVLLVTVFTIFSCGEELEFNTPSFQAKKDGNLFEAVTFRANIDNTGVLTITGSDNFETVTLVVNSTVVGIHDVVATSSSATIEDINDVVWSTNNVPDPSVQLYPASGVIDLKEVDLIGNTVSGEFYFNAFNASGLSSVNYNQGFFHKVAIIGNVADTPDTVDVPCATAEIATAVTALNFAAVMPGDATYVSACNAYKTALMTQITSCGDASGALQAAIDGLSCM